MIKVTLFGESTRVKQSHQHPDGNAIQIQCSYMITKIHKKTKHRQRKNILATLMKQSTVHISDSDLPQSLKQSKDGQSWGIKLEERENVCLHGESSVNKPLQHPLFLNLRKGNGTSNGCMVSLNDRETFGIL